MQATRLNLLIATTVFCVAAWFGIGIQSEDEFQHVILIAQDLRGLANPADIPLDVHAQWRSMLLPVIAAGVFEACAIIGITDPFALTLLLRLITAALAIWALRDLARIAKPMLRAENRVALDALNWFLWFVPILLMRFTGEVWSTLFFVRGLALLLDTKPRSPWAIGACWGLAVIIRPAAAIMPLGAWLWVRLFKKEATTRLWRMVAGGAFAIIACTALDSICYNTVTAPLWNYLVAAASGQENQRFTALPWYHYGLFVIKHATIPIGALLIASLGILLWLKRRHVLVWVIVPFLVVHAIMPIKELRFLFPLAPLAPWLLVTAWDALCARRPLIMQQDIWLRLLFPFAVVNLLALMVAMVTPAGNGRIKLARDINARYGQQPVHIDVVGGWRLGVPSFYLSEGSTLVFVDRIVPSKEKSPHLVIAKESADLDRVKSLERIALAAPLWTHRLQRWHGLEDGYDPLVLYRLTTENIGH